MDEALRVMAALTPVVLGVLAFLTEKARRDAVWSANKAEHAAVAAASATQRVEDTLATTTDQTTEKLETIHTLVNSRMTEALAKIDRLETKLYHATGISPHEQEKL